MGVVLRLTRRGANNKPYYRIVAADRRFSRDGRFLELLGTYDPKKSPSEIILNNEKINYWLSKGAKPSKTVNEIIKKASQTTQSK